jgi:hypothetical protein
MYIIKTVQEKNRLYVTLIGFFTVVEMKKCVDETIQATKKLTSGYDVITDISQFKPGIPEVAKEIERAQAHFASSGVRRGLRVVGESALTGMQFNRTGKQAGYNSNNIDTLEEAERILDNQ